jgi:hypothetical protein
VGNCSTECNASGAGGASSSGGTGEGGNTGNGETGSENSACYIAEQSSCTATAVPTSEKATLDAQCTDAGGVAGDSCPSKDLIGCCTFGGTGLAASSKVCSYKTGSGFDQASCSAASGTWSTRP